MIRRKASLGIWKTIASIFLVLLSVAPRQASAQGEASISGTVADTSGAIIPGATVKVKNVEIGTVRTLVTDNAGRYAAPSLEVGKYEISAEKEGFRAEVKTGITVAIGQRAEVNLMLAVGTVKQSISVSETALQLAVTTADFSGLVGEAQVKDLPLNGRSYDQLLTLNPGVVNYTSQRSGGIGTSNSVVGNMFSASGRRPQENLYILNGVEYTSASEVNNTPGGTSGQLLGVDAVREFSVVTDAYGAEYGKRPGAQINIVTASGTDQLHGDAYEFLRNSALDARNFFDLPQIPHFERNVFGASLGGPIKKNKSFLFGNYEGFRQALGLSDLTLVPDGNARLGILPCAALTSVTSSCNASTPTTTVTLGKGVANLLNLWPVANGPELTINGLNSGVAESLSNPQQHIREDFGTARFDQIFSNNDSFAAVYTGDDSQSFSPTTNPYSTVDIFLREQVASLSETHIFSPNILNKATFGFSRGAFYFNSGVTGTASSVTGGWVNTIGVNVPGAVVIGGGTTLNGASALTNGGTNAGSNLTAVRNLFTYDDQVSITHGKHLITFGAWFERVQANDNLIQDQYGQASFNNLQTFLTGAISTYTFASAATPLSWRSLEGAFFAEDSIKLTPSLEVRLGFRGEFTNGWNEANGRASNYLFTNGVINTNPTVGNSAFTVNNAKFLPAPRVGIAWSPFGSKKTVIRAGAGFYYALIDNLSYRLDQNGPFNTVQASKKATVAEIEGTGALPTPQVIPSGVQPDLQTPTVISYDLKIEQQILPNTTLSVGYSGSHGYHEILSIDANVPSNVVICPATPCPANYPSGAYFYYASLAAPLTGTPALANSAVSNTTHWFSEGVSSYNALEVDVNHQFSHGLTVRGVYTFSKALDDGDSMNTSVATNSPAFASNPLNPLQSDYGRASFDVRHAAVINATYDLPFGRKSASGENRWLSTALGNWQISGIETLVSGLPFTPQLSYNPSNDGDSRNPVRPSLNPAFTGSIIEGTPGQYFNPNAFIQPLANTYGNAPRNFLQGPGLATTDFSVSKKFLFTERLNLQFRAELFNIFNRTNFNNPNPVVFTSATSVLPSASAGAITSTSTSSRQVQFGLKLLW
ncbi:MAG TPA: carboxypeptidase-like regulatory domain-containing protein [Candidatus Saccharimonadales bacterium]|nr:carboxypeptidase-like regulatory domain-containing protein [Candidatus Saccharimonadales bacterium]